MTKTGGPLSNPTVLFLLALGGAAGAGLLARWLYSKYSTSERRKWREALPHHGGLGVPMTLGGALSGNPIMAGAGLGLVLSDLDDKDEWFG